MAVDENNENLKEALSLSRMLTEARRAEIAVNEEGNKIWNETNDLIKQYNKTLRCQLRYL
jgi:hypothetical protein